MPYFDFKCDKCGKITEKNVPSNFIFITCKDCGVLAWKQPSAPAFKVK